MPRKTRHINRSMLALAQHSIYKCADTEGYAVMLCCVVVVVVVVVYVRVCMFGRLCACENFGIGTV